MRSKHEIMNKFDYMKAYSFNLILTERTNCELEKEQNVGKIDKSFYRIFSWQIMGKKKERQLSQGEQKETVKAKKYETVSNLLHQNGLSHERLQEGGRVHKEDEEIVSVESRTEYDGRAPKRYVSKCYFKPTTVPAWYTESLLIFIGSTKRKYDEKIYFKHKLQPYYYSESMTTEVNCPLVKPHLSEILVPTEKSEVHYMSLEPQQLAAVAAS